jgi:DNA-binding Xre family transcriptional regulator
MKTSKKFKSDFEEFVSSPKRKKLLDKKYQELCLTEFVLSLMEEEAISVRALAKEIGVSPTVIQDIRSNKHSNITLSTFFGLTSALGATIKLEIGDKIITLTE